MSIQYENKKHIFSCSKRNCLRASAHLHSHVEIIYMLDGHSTAWVDDSEYPLNPGDVFITFPNQVHRYETREYEDYWILLIPQEMCSQFNPWFKNCVPKSNVIHADEYPKDRFLRLLEEIHRLSRENTSEFDQIALRGHIISFVATIFNALEFAEEKMAEVSVMKQMLSFCAANYTEELSLELLEKELHVNRFYISHLFSKKLKIKFNDYVNSLRVASACKLLQETNMNMTDIVSASGFTTSRTFNRAFLKIMGETPSKFRKNCRNM